MNQPSGPTTSRLVYGASGDYPLGGDWNGNGTDTIGVGANYRAGT